MRTVTLAEYLNQKPKKSKIRQLVESASPEVGRRLDMIEEKCGKDMTKLLETPKDEQVAAALKKLYDPTEEMTKEELQLIMNIDL